MTPAQAGLIAGTGLAAGIINSVAGGGSFLTFPVLVSCGLPSITANATSTVALVPGTLASFWAYRREMAAQRRLAVVLTAVSVVGGAVGAWVLLHTRTRTFDELLPWLTLFATLLFTFGKRLAERLKITLGEEDDAGALVKTGLIQFVISIYGGYYGAGAGTMMLAVLQLLGMRNIHAMNALKTLLNAAFNGAAIVMFVALRRVVWPAALLMMGGAIVGGFGGAWVAQRMSAAYVRWFVIVTGAATTVYFFERLF